MKVTTTRFGELEVAENEVYELTSALPGFPETKSFFFIQKDKIAPFQWMQSVEEANLTFVVVEPYHFFHDYYPKISAFDAREIGAEVAEDIRLFAIVVLPEDMTKMTANLRGPLILNSKELKLKQVFIETDRWTVRESIVEAIKRKEQAAIEKSKQEKA